MIVQQRVVSRADAVLMVVELFNVNVDVNPIEEEEVEEELNVLCPLLLLHHRHQQ